LFQPNIDPDWPNALRWFLVQGLRQFAPWHFISEPAQCEAAATAFLREDLHRREVFVFAFRQDCDDFAGLELANGVMTNRVICFHPSFSSNVPGWDIVDAMYEDVFEFVASHVIPEMKAWADTEDAGELVWRNP
jgi:hypothetical protein